MFIILFCIWLVLNGGITPEIVIIGLCICIALMGFMRKFLNFSIKKEIRVYTKFGWLFVYACVLLVEIIKSNLAVAKIMMDLYRDAEPVYVIEKSPLKTNLANMILGTSITLTPGTITVSFDEGNFEIHCLDKMFAEPAINDRLVWLLKKLEG